MDPRNTHDPVAQAAQGNPFDRAHALYSLYSSDSPAGRQADANETAAERVRRAAAMRAEERAAFLRP